MSNEKQKSRSLALRCGAMVGANRYALICETPGCRWAGDAPDENRDCPKCGLDNLLETVGWEDEQLPTYAFSGPNK